MKQIINTLFIGMSVMLLVSCSSSLSEKATGVYNGAYTVSGLPVGTGTVTVSEVDETHVNIVATGQGFTYAFSNVTLSETDGIVTISYSDVDETLSGNVNGNALNLTYQSGNATMVFSGSK